MSRITQVDPSPTRTAQLPLSLLVLVSFALAFSYLMARATAFYQPAEYPADWGNARWIGGEEVAATRYFRFRFDVNGTPRAAYLIVGGTDEINVYVNGNLLAAKTHVGTGVTEILDLRSYLLEGENLVAVRVRELRGATQPLLIARLVLETAAGARRELLSGPAWQVSAREMRKPADDMDWTSVAFDDRAWPHAVAIPPPGQVPQLPLRVAETLFDARPATWNIWSSGASPQATLARYFEIPDRMIHGAWLEVAFVGQYAIAINGRLLHSEVSANKSTEVFAVGPYLRPGLNRLELSAETLQRRPHIHARLLVDTDKGDLWVPTDGRWLVSREGAEAAVSFRPVQVLDRVMSRLEHRSAGLVLRDLSTEDFLSAAEWRAWSVYALWVLAAAALLFPFFRLAVRHRIPEIAGILGIFAQPFLFGLLAMLALILAGADPRLHSALAIGSTTMWVLAGLVLAWLTLIALEAVLRRRHSHG